MRIHLVPCLGLLIAGLLPPTFAARADGKKVLMLTKSSAYQHAVVARGKDGSLGPAEQTVVDLGKKHGFDVTVTKDGRKINAENLKNYDALFFFTQGELTDSGVDKQPPMRPADRQAILDFVAAGGGFVGTHCGGADTFHKWTEGAKKPFLAMVGGEFIGHGKQQATLVKVVDPAFPAVAGWPANFELKDEWYAYGGFTGDIHVLMTLQTEGMKDDGRRYYAREPYPITWCKNHGKGRVFYTGLGHREDVWRNPLYRKMVSSAVRWALRDIEGSAAPNLKSLYGSTKKGLVRISPPTKK